ncbi:hypothetical protein MAPG_05291 [Magnaporthiopsis poae ATCC 64411]|uniref:Uncharacterized protein n=1 Tax=Magnaporthiopsis poae (strain ATCC 64411 / 73-15) TaxID=644358 RepID=A0A0C4DZ04_MAGP6|nr:hypothetical protein MAPG_05291 [Magnaporthiopsis poae ATCC 64411]
MGFLSIFSRKSSSRQASRVFSRGVKAQPYENTRASDTPFKGTYPVAGNGPNTLDTLSKSDRFKQTQVSLSDNSIDPAAPAPTISYHCAAGSSSSGRADVAPSEGTLPVAATASKRQNSSRGPPLSFRKLRDQPSLSSSRSETPEFAQYGAGFTQVFPPSHYAAASHRRNSSLFTDGGKSVDVLDAHSEISPLDFRSRVKAAGAKDFGEDVADRNMSQNTYNLDSSQVQAFYGTLPRGGKAPSNRDLPLTAVRRPRAKTDASPPRQKQHVKAPSFSLFPDRAASEMAAARGADRMASLRTYTPTGSGSASSGKRPHSMHRSAMPSELRRPATAGSAVPSRPATSWGDSGRSPEEDVPPLPHYVPKRLEDLLSKPSRLPVAVPNPEKQSPFRFPPATYRPSSSGRPGTSSNRGSVQPSSSWAKCTRHALQPSVSSLASGGSGELAGVDSAPAPYVGPPPTHSDSRVTAEPDRGHGYSRSRSMILPKAGQLEEIYEHVPERGSSLRNWSLTSDTQSISSLSTNFFGNRPQSRHTANTSIDASFHTAHAFSSVSLPLSSARGSIYSTDHQGKLQLVADDAPPIPGRRLTDGFEVDDYISSDDDSFIAPRRHRQSASEEDLLFRDTGYGFAELPGLHDALYDAASGPPAILRPPPQPRQRPATSAGTLQCHHTFRESRRVSPPRGHRPITSVASIFTTPSRGRSRRRRQSSAAEAATLDEQEYPRPQSSQHTPHHSDAASIRPSHRGRKGSKRLSAFGSPFPHSGEHDEDNHTAPAPEVPISLKSTKSVRSVKTTTTTDTARTITTGAVPPMPNSNDTSSNTASNSTNNYDNTAIITGDNDQTTSDNLPTTKADIAAVVRFRKLDKARRRTMEMAMHRGDKAAAAVVASSSGPPPRKDAARNA